MKQRSTKRSPLSYERKKRTVGYLFLLPWLIGMVFFFIGPIFQSILFSLGELRIGSDYGVTITGFNHYIKAFTEDSNFIPLLTASLPPYVYQVPITVFLSLFLALLLNRKFFGRTVVRGIFFLPIIIANGVVITILNGDAMSQDMLSQNGTSAMFNSEMLGLLMEKMPGGSELMGFVTTFVDSVFSLLWTSGIQTLLFMTALQSIPVSMYEAARMEGGTSWEIFWKITLPMTSSTILLNVVYTLIDTFGSSGNRIMRYIFSYVTGGDFNYSAAMMWVYTLIVGLAVAICFWIINRFVYYEV